MNARAIAAVFVQKVRLASLIARQAEVISSQAAELDACEADYLRLRREKRDLLYANEKLRSTLADRDTEIAALTNPSLSLEDIDPRHPGWSRLAEAVREVRADIEALVRGESL